MPADEDLIAARELAEGALRALAAGGHETIAAEMFRRAAALTDAARREVWLDEVLAPTVEIVLDDSEIDALLDGVAAPAGRALPGRGRSGRRTSSRARASRSRPGFRTGSICSTAPPSAAGSTTSSGRRG